MFWTTFWPIVGQTSQESSHMEENSIGMKYVCCLPVSLLTYLHDCRSTIEVYGHESATKFHSLDPNLFNGTVELFADNVALLMGKSAANK
jgi:hypothetical protein